MSIVAPDGSNVVVVEPIIGTLDADITLPGSKSITNRALITAALAAGTTTLTGVGLSDDTRAMIGALELIGVESVIADDQTTVTVHGRGGDFLAPIEPLDANMSGTSARFLLPVLALVGSGTLTGHEQMRARPMGTLADALRDLGADVDSNTLPISISSPVTEDSVAIDASVSSQFISALLLAAPLFPNGLTLTLTGAAVSMPYIEMTIAVMASFGALVTTLQNDAGHVISVEATGYSAVEYHVEPDASTASYPLAAAAIVGGRVRVLGLGSTSLQGDAQFAERVLAPMGATVFVDEESIEVRGSGMLDPLTVDLGDMSDTAPTFAALAAKASGTSSVTGIGFIRSTKESDRVQGSVDELNRVGVSAVVDADGFTVTGGLHENAVVQTYEDHRMAMAFALVGLTDGPITIDDPGCVAKTCPGYWTMLDTLRSSARQRPRVLAIDGPAGSGKSTIAKRLAAQLQIPHLDTGAMYRAVTFAVLKAGVGLDELDRVGQAARDAEIVIGPTKVLVNGEDVTTAIREPEVTAAVSVVAANPQVRVVLVEAQRHWATVRGGAVIEGRDIGTAVFPDAELKIYLNASVEERARRRAAETGDDDIAAMATAIAERDHLDMTRETDPLTVAEGATQIDSTSLTIDEVVDAVVNIWIEGGS